MVMVQSDAKGDPDERRDSCKAWPRRCSLGLGRCRDVVTEYTYSCG